MYYYIYFYGKADKPYTLVQVNEILCCVWFIKCIPLVQIPDHTTLLSDPIRLQCTCLQAHDLFIVVWLLCLLVLMKAHWFEILEHRGVSCSSNRKLLLWFTHFNNFTADFFVIQMEHQWPIMECKSSLYNVVSLKQQLHGSTSGNLDIPQNLLM